ncbi:dihydroneopterin triphosphate diphosphatase [Neisseria leonii]|uniref:Dihydroneopterin triphosphate diphosphatase n=1 Tax=Neisseria leonii TaxID=2995413 RepID=A0A9X4DZR6_9NEIS|nr:dihydroneopterin triphosphate diphosphatase [Neisseria sp. 51.81]MDD9326812.1 dihydroneopterin triphosphate diphosphatase [Neisseria sp. 51.81]
MMRPLKQPVSVLVVLHDGNGSILLLERADRAGFWQSVTGSVEPGESPAQTALREVAEETGIILPAAALDDWQHSTVYEIYPHWRHRYPPGVTENTEHTFSARIDRHTAVHLSEHTAYCWLDTAAAAEKVFSPSNREAILKLAGRSKAV